MTRLKNNTGGETGDRNRVYPPLIAIIVAGGSGLRAGGGLPKQFRNLCGTPVFVRAAEAFIRVNPSTRIILVTHPDYVEMAREGLSCLDADWQIVIGGRNRWESVRRGLEAIDDIDALVAVHDAARPLVTDRMIVDGWDTSLAHDTAVPCVPVTDSLRCFTSGGTESVDRSRFMAVQTPQVFDLRLLRQAYARPFSETFTDDASVVEDFGHDITIFDGDAANIKITRPVDFAIAEVILSE